MPLYATSEEWQHYTTLLLRARPTTTRIVTKYHIPPPPSDDKAAALANKRSKYLARKAAHTAEAAPEQKATDGAAEEKRSKAYLELRTYDPESGVVLKYRTSRAQEVGRLIGSLGRMGRIMGALPEESEDVAMEDAPVEEGKGEKAKAAAAAAAVPAGKGEEGGEKAKAGGGQGGGGTKGKKKKGKR